MTLPSFLRLLPSKPAVRPISAVFDHKDPLQPVHAYWWPPVKQVSRIILFIPGNPGLLDFYTLFLDAIHSKDSDGSLAILAHSLLGMTPGIGTPGPTEAYSLAPQIQNALEAFDALSQEFPQSKVILVGHSVGAYISMQILKERGEKVSALFLLFPGLCYLRDTPNGRRLSRYFRPPLPRLISFLAYVLQFLPIFILSRVFREWPRAQISALQSLLSSPTVIFSALSMADDEMRLIRALDEPLLRENREKIWMYFAEVDDWVGENRDLILRVFHDNESVRIVHDKYDIPHAFSINHGEHLAQQCHEWLKLV